MFKFKYKEKFSCSAKLAFDATTRDFEGLEKYIPNVTKIIVETEEKLDDGSMKYFMRFHGDGAIPLVVQTVIKPSMLRWSEEMICNPNDLTIEWKIITDHFTEHVHCYGKTYYYDRDGGASELEIDGYFDVTLKSFPPFPDKLVQKAIQMFEPFIGKLIAPNMGKFYRAIKQRMKKEGMID